MAKVRQVKVTWEKSPNDRSFSVRFKDTGNSYKYTEQDLIDVIQWYFSKLFYNDNFSSILFDHWRTNGRIIPTSEEVQKALSRSETFHMNLRTLLNMLHSCAHGYRILSHEARLFMDLYNKKKRIEMWEEIQERRREKEEEHEQDDE